MIKVKIGTEERRLETLDREWILERIKWHRAQGLPVCLQVRIDHQGVCMRLTTPNCAGSGGGGCRPPNDKERRLFDLWNGCHLNTNSFGAEDFVAFLRQLFGTLN
ncbi:MAG: hypothetical protein L0Y42_02170 [Phycisphaerales bacterium]|nr:hypothetical protein [Phycisphaerales bacterium]